ncbi:putative extracellular dioxygenase [Rosellinia necatrix]|uniref:Putative extracellular dioxygenase n=1 Tax=Rosellinia necatrix TaxID=77044 RepID=A0A1W2TMF9_ROSNE|nr:putative extracellular dioxygenase [Rosellinia necatrix]
MRFSTVLAASAATLVVAHPGEDHHDEVLARRDFISNVKRSDLSHCAAKMKARGIEKRAMMRRRALADARSKRGILARELSDINKSHLSDADYDLETPLDVIFSSNASCLMSPEVTEGPYYVGGEYIRQDLTENELGVVLTLDIAVFDVETCDPVTDAWVEIWSCNSTGVYSGVPSGADYSDAPENVNTTFLRGFQQTDSDGALSFDTIYPGHYSGRTQHIHVMVHPDATPRENQTIFDTTASHVGQIFFDQDLTDLVETVSPYSTNTQPITTNSDDMLISTSLATSDAIVNYVMLGETVSDGILAWISFGINTTYTSTPSVAATYYEGGGVANENAGSPPPGFPTGPSS